MTRDELLVAAEKTIAGQSMVPLACVKLARHIQRLYDPTPVDEGWFVSAFHGKPAHSAASVFLDKYEFAFERAEKRKPARIILFNDGCSVVDCPTRGDVRRLCDALGIELREGA